MTDVGDASAGASAGGSGNTTGGSVDGMAAGANGSLPLPENVTRTLNAIAKGQDMGCQNWKGLMFELIVYDRSLSAADLTRTEAYLREKWDCCPE